MRGTNSRPIGKKEYQGMKYYMARTLFLQHQQQLHRKSSVLEMGCRSALNFID